MLRNPENLAPANVDLRRDLIKSLADFVVAHGALQPLYAPQSPADTGREPKNYKLFLPAGISLPDFVARRLPALDPTLGEPYESVRLSGVGDYTLRDGETFSGQIKLSRAQYGSRAGEEVCQSWLTGYDLTSERRWPVNRDAPYGTEEPMKINIGLQVQELPDRSDLFPERLATTEAWQLIGLIANLSTYSEAETAAANAAATVYAS